MSYVTPSGAGLVSLWSAAVGVAGEAEAVERLDFPRKGGVGLRCFGGPTLLRSQCLAI